MSRRANRWGYIQCPMCDEWYPESDVERAKVHRHPEPQSGPPREALLRFNAMGGGGYERWILLTPEGRSWAERRS